VGSKTFAPSNYSLCLKLPNQFKGGCGGQEMVARYYNAKIQSHQLLKVVSYTHVYACVRYSTIWHAQLNCYMLTSTINKLQLQAKLSFYCMCIQLYVLLQIFMSVFTPHTHVP